MQIMVLGNRSNRIIPANYNGVAVCIQTFIGEKWYPIMLLSSQVPQMKGVGFGIVTMGKPFAVVDNFIETVLRHMGSDLAVWTGKWQVWL